MFAKHRKLYAAKINAPQTIKLPNYQTALLWLTINRSQRFDSG